MFHWSKINDSNFNNEQLDQFTKSIIFFYKHDFIERRVVVSIKSNNWVA